MRIFVDSDHAAETVTRQSRTRFLCFLNQAPINWVSKKQGSCETSTFSSKFVVMKNATEYAIALQYKVQVAYDGHSVMSWLLSMETISLFWPIHRHPNPSSRRSLNPSPITLYETDVLVMSGGLLTSVRMTIQQTCWLSPYLQGRRETILFGWCNGGWQIAVGRWSLEWMYVVGGVQLVGTSKVFVLY
jgi:hypothetical protein